MQPSSLPPRVCSPFRKHAHLMYFLLLAALTLVLLSFFLFVSYRQTEQTVTISSANEAHVLASQLDAALRRIRAATELVAHNLPLEALSERFPSPAITRANNQLQALGNSFPEIRGHRYYDAVGRLVLTSDPAMTDDSIADQPFFQQMQQQPRQGLFFSETLSTTPLTLVAYQAVLDAGGTLQGLIVTPVDLHFFERLFAQMDVGAEGMISIRRSDTSRLVVRWPELMAQLNNEAKDIPPQKQIQRGVAEGVVRYVGKTDGVDRIFAFHKIDQFPFYVLVGRAPHEQFAGWRKMAGITSALTAAALVLLGVFLFRLRDSEQRLHRSESHYQAIVESQQDAVCRWLPDTTLTFANTKYLELFAANGSDRLLGQQWIDWIAPEERGAILDLQARLRERPTPASREGAVPVGDGSVRHFHWVDVPLLDAAGKCAEIQSVGRDITELRQAEAEHKRLQLQLVQAQKMEAIGTLAGGIAHDFNNILGAIIGYTELALDGCDPQSTLARDLTHVLQASQRAAALVKQILAFSRQTDSERSTLVPAVIVKEAIKLLRPSLPSTIAIVESIDPEVDSIHADPVQLHQIVMNLCTNAFHAMENDGGVLTLALRNRAIAREELRNHPEVQPGQFVELSISDTGIGIAPEIQDKIFEPYFTTKEVGKGTGMGLAIIHGIVAAHRGFVVCESAPGKGATFRIAIPAIGKETTPESSPIEKAAPGKERILFIDDEPLLAELGKAMLARLGYEVTVRTSSQEALATFRNHPESFDVVITDQTMPGMTGMEMAEQMLQTRPTLPIILCTGYSSLISEEKVFSMGIKGFALKPLSRKEISLLLRQVLDRRPESSPAV